MINPMLSYTEESQLKSRCKANTGISHPSSPTQADISVIFSQRRRKGG